MANPNPGFKKNGERISHNKGFNNQGNSIAARINAGDPELLAALGMTKKEAKRKLHAWRKNNDIEGLIMDHWAAAGFITHGVYTEQENWPAEEEEEWTEILSPTS